jgi:hypothetical protein
MLGTERRRRRICALVICGAIAPAVFGAASAQATTVTLGSPLTNPGLVPQAFGPAGTVAQTALPGATLVSPFNGTIVSWRVIGASGGPFKLRVVRPLAGGLFTAAGTATSGPLTSTGVLTFTANLPIRAGDLVGLDNVGAGDTIGATGAGVPPGSSYVSFVPPLADGSGGRAPSSTPVRELGFNATVESNCIVPTVLGLDLAAATAAIEAVTANCDLGTVTQPKKKKGKKKARLAKKKKKKKKLVVVSQSPAAGTEGPFGTDVALTLGNKKKKKKKKK